MLENFQEDAEERGVVVRSSSFCELRAMAAYALTAGAVRQLRTGALPTGMNTWSPVVQIVDMLPIDPAKPRDRWR